ncbi:MAG: hypothetical protein PSX81_09190 [bacterium]|nr:hypothetical protein [bacterium]
MKIVASIYAYNFHLIVSYLNDGIRIIPFKDNRSKFFNSKAEYSFDIPNIYALTELQAKSHILYGTSEQKLTSFNLATESKFSFQTINEHQIPITDVSQLSINYKQNNLFALSENKGIFQIDISNSHNPKIDKKIIPEAFEKLGQPVVSNIESTDNNLFIAIRNFGVTNIVIDKQIHKERKELRSEDPQDVKRLSYHNIIVVADSQDGLILYDFDNSKLIKKIQLPNSDFPQQIETTSAAIIIKGISGLYAYYLTNNRLITLREGKIGALTLYYDYIFFTSKGKLFSMTINDSFDKHGFTYDKDRIELEIIRRKN